MASNMHVDGVDQLYPSERNELIMIRHQLLENMGFKPGTESDLKRRFEEQARNRCGEIGLVVSVNWEYDVSDDPYDQTLYLSPVIVVERRVNDEEETDHDRMKIEIISGEADGKAGVIDPVNPGKLKDPSKKVL